VTDGANGTVLHECYRAASVARKAKMRRLLDTEAQEARSVSREQRDENRRFHDRLRFDQSTLWTGPEPRSWPPSSWPAFAEACMRWGIPAGRRLIPWRYRTIYER